MDLANIDLTQGVIALVLGMTTVFVILILISLVISMFQWFDFEDGIKLKKKSKHKEKDKEPQVVVAQPSAFKKADDLELVAVITAAIAASMNTTTDQLEITSFRQITEKTRGSWTIRH